MTKKLVFIASTCILLMIFVSGCPQPHNPSPVTTVPDAPKTPIKEAVSETTISISWNAVDGATGYDVYLSELNDQATAKKENTAVIADTDYMITKLEVSTEYYIWLKATNTDGDSDFSPVLIKITDVKAAAAPSTPATPTKGIATDTTISISWDAVNGANGYDVYLNTSDNKTTAKKKNTAVIADTDYMITGLTANTPYYIWLKATNTAGDSGFSPSLPKTTARIFNALRIKATGGDENIKVMAHLAKSTVQLEIYLQDGGSMSTADINYIANEFAKDYPTLTDIYGTHRDVDGNKNKIIILLYDMNEDPSGPGGYVAGYFSPKDLFKPNPNDWTALSNKAEILYVESEVSGEIKGIYDTVIHEYQHLINFNMNYVENNTKETDLWLNEALSESTAIVKSEGMPINRLAIYNDFSTDPNYSSPFHQSILSGNYFYYWNTDGYVLADYATASLFMYWLYLNGEGNDTFKKIAQANPNKRGDEKAVLEAIANTSSLNSLDSWQDVLFAWLEANENEAVGYPGGRVVASDGSYLSIDGLNVGLRTKIADTSKATGSIRLYPGDALLTTVKTTAGDRDIVRKTFSSTQFSLTVYTTLNKDVKTEYPVHVNLSVGTTPLNTATRMYDFSRRSNFPVLLDDGYRIRPRSQTLLPEGDFE